MASSSPTQMRRHDVFTSFHGPDVRRRFVSHLHTHLKSKGITVFNDEEIERGAKLATELVQAINESRVSIVVLSKNYASSRWCLDELVEILKCKEASGMIVMTIFYDVDPSDVRKQTGDFGKTFSETCIGQTKEGRQSWSKALTHIANIAGEHSLNWENEAEMIQYITKDVSNKLYGTISRDFNGIVGLQTHLRKLETLLCCERDEVKMIGIWGPVGIGKTTIAGALFNQLSTRFRFSCFMGNLEEYNKSTGVYDDDSKLRLQSQLLSKIFNQSDLRVHHLGELKERLTYQRVLIILDGVDDLEILEALAKELSWFGPGSRIIITTEDKKILNVHGINDIYHVDFPSEKEAVEILRLSAFKQSYAPDGFEEIANKVAKLCGNLPLGLRVVGSSLGGRSKDEWELYISRIEGSLDRKIEDVLRAIYNRLVKEDQSLFLHIACFFSNDTVDYVATMLANKALDVRMGLKTLADKSLVQISSNGRIVMHPLLQQLGKQIYFNQSNEPGKPQFPVRPEEINDELENETDTVTYAREMTGETECILIFSCNENLDLDETSFIESISKELYKRQVTPLTYNLSGGENVDEEMLCRSKVGIVILSDSYACSRQSLDHLVAIMEHCKATDFVIIPIYFKVTPSDVSGLKGRFEARFLQLQSSLQEDRVQIWKAAVTEIVSIGGREWTKGNQSMLVDEVVRNASLRLHLKNSKNLARILSLLNHSQSSDAEFFGIWGMPGIGKTAIAREIYEILKPQYDLCYFLQDFYLTCQKKGLRQMRDDFISKVFGEEKLRTSACDIKPSFMRDCFRSKKILVVIDDVSNARDAEAVVGGFGWFSHGHRIILTSRRKQVLVQCKVKEPYEIQRLCESESSALCKQYLIGGSEVISEILSCSSGIPLCLEVLSSSMSKQHINNMKEHLQSLRRKPPLPICEAFQRSFDGLDEYEKNIFLDLACFFRGENIDHVVQLLDACGFFTFLGISDLIDESLISLLEGRIEIPIPFQDCGRFFVHEEDKDPCERSRLWDSDDIADVFAKNSGTEAIEGIFLDASDLTCELSPTVFSEMYSLRLLKIYCSTTSGNQCKLSLPQGLHTLPDELRLLHWEHYPLECLPEKFISENLVEINMAYSNMEKLWEGKKNLEKLKTIKLSHSRKLTDTLMLSEALNLEHIDLEGCTSLIDVSTSITHLRKLVSLNMKDCFHLRSLPSIVDLTSLKLVNLSGCSELEDIQDFPPNLKELYLAGTAIRKLPFSAENLSELTTLDLENCVRLQKLPSGVRNSRSIVDYGTSLELRKRKR